MTNLGEFVDGLRLESFNDLKSLIIALRVKTVFVLERSDRERMMPKRSDACWRTLGFQNKSGNKYLNVFYVERMKK